MSANIVIDELPDWMKQARRGVDWGVLIIMGLCLLIGWHFTLQTELPRTNETEQTLFRAVDAVEALREGRLYPRWSPHVYGGYGAPIPHYYPPAAANTVAFVHLLFTNDTNLAIRVIFMLSFVMAGTMVYVLVMQRSNGIAGIIAALLYVLSPYVGLTAPRVIGDVAEVMALALLPALLWAINRLLQRNQPIDIVFITGFSAALILTAPTYFFVGLMLAAALSAPRERQLMAALGCGLGILLTAFYWLPALLEFNSVTWVEQGIQTLPYYLTFSDLFAPLQALDGGALFHTPTFNIGWLQIICVGLGLPFYWRGGYERRFFLLGIAALILPLVLYPEATWFMGIAALCFAIAGSSTHHIYERLPLKPLLLIGAMALIIGVSSPIWLGSDVNSPAPEPLPLEQLQYEDEGYGVAVLSARHLVPTTHQGSLSRTLYAGYEDNFVNRVAAASTGTAQISVLEEASHYSRYQVNTIEATEVVIQRAYFDGWQATIDGTAIPLEEDSNTGLLRIHIPANTTGILTVTLGATGLRFIAWFVSLGALVGVMGLSWWRWQRLSSDYDLPKLVGRIEARILLSILCIAAVIRIIPQGDDLFAEIKQPNNYSLQDTVVIRSATRANIQLLGYTLPQDTLRTGDTLHVTLYWSAIRDIDGLYQVRLLLHATDTEQIVFESPLHVPSGYPTFLWHDTGFVRDVYNLTLPDTLAAGTYTLQVEMLDCEDDDCETAVEFLSSNRRPIGYSLTLTRIHLLE